MDTNAKFLDIISRAGNSDISDEDFFELGKIFSKMDLDRKYKSDTKLVHPDLHPDDTQASKEVMQTAMKQLNARRDRLYSKYRIQEHPNDKFEVVSGSSYSSSGSYSDSSYGQSSSQQSYGGGYQDSYSGQYDDSSFYGGGSDGYDGYGRKAADQQTYDYYYGQNRKKPGLFGSIAALILGLLVMVVIPGLAAFIVSKGLGDYLHGGIGALTDTALYDGTTAGFGKIGYPFWTAQEMLRWAFCITIGIHLLSALFSGRDSFDMDTIKNLFGSGARTFIAVHIFVFIANVVQAELPAFQKFDLVEIGGMSLLALLAWNILPRKTLINDD